jgi:hypothetical protein
VLDLARAGDRPLCGVSRAALDPQVTQKPVERPPVGIVILPQLEVADVAVVAQALMCRTTTKAGANGAIAICGLLSP